MPINPNIALGIQPVQQPNLLGQMGQIMAIRAAQQEMEGSQEARNYFAKPASERGDPSRLLGTKQGQAAYKALNEGQIKQLEATQKRVGLIGAGAGAVLQNPTVENFRNVVENLVNNQVYSREDADKAIATIGNDPSKIPSFVTPLYRQAISAEKDLADKTSRANAATAAGPGHRQATLAEQKYENQLKAGGDIITSLVKDPETGQDVEMQFRRNLRTGDFEPVVLQPPSTRVEVSPSSASSLFAPSGAGGGAPNVNALTTQGGAAAAPNVNALTQAPTFGRPKVPFTAPVPVLDENNRPVFVSGREAIGKTPATSEALKLIKEEKVTKAGKESVNRVLGNLYSEYTNLVKTGGITDTRQSVEENISARTGASAVGQLTGSFTGSEAQSFRDSIEQTRPLLLTAIMKATGLSATQLNSNVELQTYLKTATDPKVSIQSNVKALNNISTMFGLGEKFEVPEIPKATSSPKAAKPANAVPPGLPPDIAALWPYISLEDRKLWQK
jgi:hypothetical protein